MTVEKFLFSTLLSSTFSLSTISSSGIGGNTSLLICAAVGAPTLSRGLQPVQLIRAPDKKSSIDSANVLPVSAFLWNSCSDLTSLAATWKMESVFLYMEAALLAKLDLSASRQAGEKRVEEHEG